MSIIVSDLVKIYGQQRALNGISFEVQPGEIVGFLGPNGAGKSTTMKILTGFIPQNSGTASICGIDTNHKEKDFRTKIGYLPELNPLYTEMYVKEFLQFTGRLMGLNGKALSNRMKEMIAKTGLSNEQHKSIYQLSKGYKQRVGLAAAMIHNPEVLILDEPSSGLDPNQVIEIRNLIREIGENKTVLFSTHIMQEVESLCSRVVIINKGNIVANDSIKNLQEKAGNKFFIRVELKQKPQIDSFKQLKGVLKCECVDNTLMIESNEDLREKIAEVVSSEQNLILSMQKEFTSLESVFQQLTK
jgi:ABC-2 type transport system ATP-binding protein